MISYDLVAGSSKKINAARKGGTATATTTKGNNGSVNNKAKKRNTKKGKSLKKVKEYEVDSSGEEESPVSDSEGDENLPKNVNSAKGMGRNKIKSNTRISSRLTRVAHDDTDDFDD